MLDPCWAHGSFRFRGFGFSVQGLGSLSAYIFLEAFSRGLLGGSGGLRKQASNGDYRGYKYTYYVPLTPNPKPRTLNNSVGSMFLLQY